MKKMVRASFPTFSEVVSVGESIEIQVKKGKLPCATNTSCGGKKSYSNFQKKKEGEANVVTEDGGRELNHMFWYSIIKLLLSHMCHTNSQFNNNNPISN